MDVSPPSEARPLAPSLASPPAVQSARRAARVLLVLGGERAAARALREAHAFARALGAELHVIRVVPHAERAAANGALAIGQALRASQRVMAAARHTRALCERVLSEPLPPQRSCARLGAFVPRAAQRAAELNADIIAIVGQGRQLGAVAAQLALRTGRAVLVARGRVSFTTLLAATDLESEGAPVLSSAARLGEALNAAVVALHGVPHGSAAGRCELTLAQRRRQLERAALGVAPAMRPMLLRASDSAQCILQAARSKSADIIIVGARDGAGAPTLASVVQQARRSVLVAPIGRRASALAPAPGRQQRGR